MAIWIGAGTCSLGIRAALTLLPKHVADNGVHVGAKDVPMHNAEVGLVFVLLYKPLVECVVLLDRSNQRPPLK